MNRSYKELFVKWIQNPLCPKPACTGLNVRKLGIPNLPFLSFEHTSVSSAQARHNNIPSSNCVSLGPDTVTLQRQRQVIRSPPSPSMIGLCKLVGLCIVIVLRRIHRCLLPAMGTTSNIRQSGYHNRDPPTPFTKSRNPHHTHDTLM